MGLWGYINIFWGANVVVYLIAIQQIKVFFFNEWT